MIRSLPILRRHVIAQFDGFIARYVGDGVLIYFGWPEARETDAERAVRAALAVLRQTVQRTALSGRVQVRIGIATGLVVVGEPIGTGNARQQTAIGETPNLAARLQGLAGPDTIVIAAAHPPADRRSVRVPDLGTIELKGSPNRRRRGGAASERGRKPLRGIARVGTEPLIGRDEEIDLLLRRWARAKAGDGQIVLLSGEPGIGKSRIPQHWRSASTSSRISGCAISARPITRIARCTRLSSSSAARRIS